MNAVASKDPQESGISAGGAPASPNESPAVNRISDTTAVRLSQAEAPATPTDRSVQRRPASASRRHAASTRYRKWLLLAGAVAGLAVGGYFLVPWVNTALNTVSTEDAYVNGHATFVAPRVSGQVMKVLVNDNQRVKKGDLLVQLDKEPFQVQVALKRTAVRVAEANLAAAESKARGLEAQLGAQRWKLQNASEQVDAQVALLRSQVAALRSQEAILDRPEADFKRGAGVVAASVPSVGRTTTCMSRSCGSRKPPSSRRRRRSPRPGCPSACAPSRKRARNSATCRRT